MTRGAALLAVLATGVALHANAQPAGVQTCAACHGARGEGNAASGFPPIAGQPKLYLARQLEAYADGRRPDKVMEPIAKGLTPEQREQFADYYSALPIPAQRAAEKAAPPARGKRLAEVGDNARRVQACQNCHGVGGMGQPPSSPYLAGLDRKYLQSELVDWRSGARNTDPSGQMPLIAKQLAEPDIDAVAAYYASQRIADKPAAKKRRGADSGTPTKPGAKSATPTKSGAGKQPVEGAGVEGGAATTGGAQGPGGGGGATGAGPSGSQSGGTPSPGKK